MRSAFPFVKATGPKGALKDEAKGSMQKSQRLWNEAKGLENVVKGKGKRLLSHKIWSHVEMISDFIFYQAELVS